MFLGLVYKEVSNSLILLLHFLGPKNDNRSAYLHSNCSLRNDFSLRLGQYQCSKLGLLVLEQELSFFEMDLAVITRDTYVIDPYLTVLTSSK